MLFRSRTRQTRARRRGKRPILPLSSYLYLLSFSNTSVLIVLCNRYIIIRAQNKVKQRNADEKSSRHKPTALPDTFSVVVSAACANHHDYPVAPFARALGELAHKVDRRASYFAHGRGFVFAFIRRVCEQTYFFDDVFHFLNLLARVLKKLRYYAIFSLHDYYIPTERNFLSISARFCRCRLYCPIRDSSCRSTESRMSVFSLYTR